MKKVILLLLATLVLSCQKDSIEEPKEELSTTELTYRQLSRAWKHPINDSAINTFLTLTSQENTIVTDTWDRAGKNSRQSLIVISKQESPRLPNIDGYDFYDTDQMEGLNGLLSDLWVAFVLVDGVNRTISDGLYLKTSVIVESGVVYQMKDGVLVEYN